jgi:hypothetical protein
MLRAGDVWSSGNSIGSALLTHLLTIVTDLMTRQVGLKSLRPDRHHHPQGDSSLIYLRPS